MRPLQLVRHNTAELILASTLLGVSLSFVPAFLHPFGVLKFIVLRFGLLLFLILVPFGLRSVRWHFVDYFLLIWLGSLALSSLFNSLWSRSLNLTEGIVLYILFYIFARVAFQQKHHFNSLVWIFIVPVVIQAGIGLLQYLQIFPITSAYFDDYETVVAGTLGGANTLGAFLAISLPMFYFKMSEAPRDERLSWGLVLTLITIVLVLTKSRGAWVASILGILVYSGDALRSFLKMKVSLKHSLLAGIGVFGAVTVLAILFYQQNPESASGRLFIWEVSLDMFRDHLWGGVGFGNFGLNWLEYQGNYFTKSSGDTYHLATSLSSAHSQYLHLLAETGIIGLGIFMALFVSTLRAIRKKLPGLDPKWQPQLVALTASLVTILTHALVDDVLNPLVIKLQFLLLLAMIATHVSDDNQKMKLKGKVSINWQRGILMILIVPLTVMSRHKIQGEILWKQGLELARIGDVKAGIPKYLKAKEHLPKNHELDFFLGAAYARIGEADKAIELIKSSMVSVSDKNQYTSLGRAYIDKKEYFLAEQTLRKALFFYPGLLFPHYWLSRVHYEQGDLTRAKSELQLILDAKNLKKSSEIKQIQADARAAMIALEKQH